MDSVTVMSFPEGPPSDEPQRYATDGRDADGTSPTAEAEDSTTAALPSEDPSEGTSESDASPADVEQESGDANVAAADWDGADRNTAVQQDGRGERASKPGGALGPGTTATGAGTALD
jgi:hypothetical protein